MKTISLEELLEAGCHFGHQITRHNPKSRDFVFEARDNIHIIDLGKTKEGLEEAGTFVKSLAAKGGAILVVGTKRQARNIVEEEVKRARKEVTSETTPEADEIHYITTRWIGGIMTNFAEINKNIKKLKDLTSRLKDEEERAKYTKKEVGLWQKELSKLRNFYDGILDMKKSPDALFIIDTHNEDLAVREAHKTDVPIVGIVDTNSDPTSINYPIPANDDAVGSIKLIVSYIIDSWIEGRKQFKKAKPEDKKESEQKSESKPAVAESKPEEKKTAKKPAVKKKKEEKSEKDVVKEVKAKKATKKEK